MSAAEAVKGHLGMRRRHVGAAFVYTLLVGLVGPGRAVGDRRDGGCHRFHKLDVRAGSAAGARSR